MDMEAGIAIWREKKGFRGRKRNSEEGIEI